MPYKRFRRRAYKPRKRRRVSFKPVKRRMLGRRRVARRLKFRSRSRAGKVARTLKHHLALQPRKKTVLTVYQKHHNAAYCRSIVVTGAYRTGNVYTHNQTTFRMNSVFDPIFAAGAGVWDTQAAYHQYCKSLYKEYRVIKSWISVRIRMASSACDTDPAGARGTAEWLDRYGSGMALSIVMDDDGAPAVDSDWWWCNLKTNPTARTMIVPPSADGQPHVYTLRHRWRLPRFKFGDDDTWVLCDANADVVMAEARGRCVLAFQRADMTGQTTGTQGFPAFTMDVRIVYKVQYRHPKDIGIPMGQTQIHSPIVDAGGGPAEAYLASLKENEIFEPEVEGEEELDNAPDTEVTKE